MQVLDRVLVVDFDETKLVETTALFEHHGFDVVPAGSIDDVLRALEPGAPRVIVMEPVLPERDGFELCRSILDSCIGVKPVVVLASARVAGHEPHFRAKDVGAHMFIERPKQDKLLIQAVTTVMQAGGQGPDPAAPGRVASRAAAAVDDTDPSDDPPVLDASFADWVDQTFTPDGDTSDDATIDDDDELQLDALGASTGEPAEVVAPAETVETAETAETEETEDEPIAAPPPAATPRRHAAVAAVVIALLVTVGGVAWYVSTRSGASDLAPAPVETAAATRAPVEVTEPGPPGEIFAIADDGDRPVPYAAVAALRVDDLTADRAAVAEPAAVRAEERVAAVRPPEPEPEPEPVPEAAPTTIEASPPVVVTQDRPPEPEPAPAIETPDDTYEPAGADATQLAERESTDDEAIDSNEVGLYTARLEIPITPEAPVGGLPFLGGRPGRTTPDSSADETLVEPEPAPIEMPAPVVREPELVRRVAPRYPPAARRWGRGGVVVLRAVVAEDGTVRDVEVVSEPVRQLGFGRAAADAVRQWSYRPSTIDGIPVERPITVEVTFRP